ncbi:MAG: putative fluoride ion transporter CrcB [Betaproteobacteria bacterium ADurb.Bin341]|nr:MAG: putative fluoride ion transporter CrcB [Betaproteobacteria bacterium ADurb.Bin341]
MTSAIAIFFGAGLGALLRWWLSLTLNPVFPTLPFGTLAANLLGGLLIGVAISFFSHRTSLPPEVRLFIITGALGGLTTFSTFSGEVATLLIRTEYLWATITASLHLFGSVTMTALGLMLANALFIRT